MKLDTDNEVQTSFESLDESIDEDMEPEGLFEEVSEDPFSINDDDDDGEGGYF